MSEGANGSWIDDLPGILWSRRTMVKEETRRIPYTLVQSEVILPTEVGISSPRSTFFEHDHNEEDKRVNLYFFTENRGNSLLKTITYK